MSSTPIKSCKKYVLSYKDSSNSTHQLGFYARDAYDCLMLAKEYPTLKDLMKEQGVSTDLSDYWDKECELNPSNPHCLEYDD